jgi:hypothetical protein
VRGDIVIEVHKDRSLDRIEKALLLALAIRADKDSGQCNPAVETICLDTGWKSTSIIEAKRRLKQRGFLIETLNHMGSSDYVIRIAGLDSSTPLGVRHADPDDSTGSGGRTTWVRGPCGGPPPGGPKVNSEEVIKEVDTAIRSLMQHDHEHDLADKVDRLLNESSTPGIFFDENGRARAPLIAGQILVREGRDGTKPPPRMVSAVLNCATHWRMRKQKTNGGSR